MFQSTLFEMQARKFGTDRNFWCSSIFCVAVASKFKIFTSRAELHWVFYANGITFYRNNFRKIVARLNDKKMGLSLSGHFLKVNDSFFKTLLYFEAVHHFYPNFFGVFWPSISSNFSFQKNVLHFLKIQVIKVFNRVLVFAYWPILLTVKKLLYSVKLSV